MMLFKRKRKRPKKQEVLFLEAIGEVGMKPPLGEVVIDHPGARCYYKDRAYNITFPLRFLRECRRLNYAKSLDFCFRGLYTTRREWVKDFCSPRAAICFTTEGRRIDKGYFDVGYYQEIASSKFTLCPAGDFKWTYRFLEAVMCFSIPVIEYGQEHPQFEGFHFFHAGASVDEILSGWNDEFVLRNYHLFLRRHTLLDRFIFLEPNGSVS